MSPRSPQIPLDPVQPGQEAAEPIAVVGLACRFPGAADADAYWRLLRDGREGLTRFTDEELIDRGVPAGLRGHPHFVPVGGLIEDQADFDPAPFGFTDAEAALLDPQHRLFLECAWHALEHAGHGGGRDAGSVGVFAGAAQSAYLASNLAGRWDPTGGGVDPLGSFQTAMATQADYLPLQTAYRLDLTGPAVAVASTCSTSLVAVHLAAQSLLAGECDTALAGGVSLIVPQGRGYLHVPDGMFSADGAVRPFSERGTGIVYTQGAGVVALRRLSDALADRDPILALLHGSAVNNDGADKAGFTAPSVGGQVKVLAEALAVAGLTPREIGLIEAHGTATRLGDPIEVTALRRAFGQSGPAWCGLGSVKGNIGHANTAAGIASFIKAVLAVHHRVLPASLHARPLNPHLGLADSPFEVITETRGWDTPPYAGVSSFGIGGTNCHAVLGPAPDLPQSSADARPQLLVVSAASPQAASAGAAAVAGAETPGQAADLAYTLAAGRAGLPYRIAAVGSERLARAVPVQALVPAPRVVLAFPGAGSPYPGMGGGLYRDEPVFTAAFDECADLLRPLLGADVRDVLDPGLAPERVRDVAFGLPALFAVSFALSRLLTSWGVQPQALVGHSLGECTVAAVSGALPLPEAARLVAARCTAAHAAGGGAMLAVPLDEEAVLELLRRHPDVDLAAVNAPGACVVSGPAAAVRAFAADLRGGGVPLHVDAAMHSRLMEGELPALRSALAGMTGGVPRLAVFSTVTGGPIGAELADPEHWVRQLRSPVRYSDALRAALGEDPALLVEAGPGTTLSTLARKHAFPGLRATVTALSAGEPESVTVRQALGVLWSHGVPVDPAAPAGAGRRRVAAPGYAFQRRRLWIEPQEPAALSADTGVGADQPLQLPVWRQVPPLEPGHVPADRWLVTGKGELPDAIRTALAAGDREEAPLAGLVIVATEPDGADRSPGTDRSPDADPVGAVVDGLLEFGAHAAALAGSTAPAVLLVTRHGERVGGDPAPDPRQAALRTLPRVLGQEHPGLRWATVDLGAPGAPAAEASLVLRELAALTAGDGAGAESVLRGGTRWQRRLVSWRPMENGHGAGSGHGTGTVLITGGLGAVGRLFAEHLAERGHRVVVTSRTGARTGAALTQAGVQVRRCDATDPGATTELLRELSQDGPVELVVHAAGVVAGAELHPVRALDPERTAEQVRAKLGGALALRTAIEALAEDRRPRTVVLMSSVTTLVGGIGMGAYAAANAAMDAFAASAVPGTALGTWCSAVWDGWRVGEEAVVLAEALDAATGTRALDRLLEAGARGVLPPAVAVAATDLNPRITAGGQPRKPVTGEGAEPASAVEEAIAGLWSDLFGAEVGASDADFFALGGHSLLAVRMLGALRDRYGVQLGLRDLLDAPTVAALAKLVEARSGSAAAHTGSDAPTPYRPAAGPDGDGTFAMTRVQHAYWVGRGGGYQWGEVPCHFYLEYDCPGLDLARYEDAWNNVLARHPMLRAVTTPEGRFRVLDDLPRYRIRVHDLTEAPEERRTAKLAALRERLSNQPGPPDRWPLVQIQAARLPDEKVRLFIGVDVLVCDAASWWIVEAELRALYQDPHAQLPPIDVHPAECAHAMDSRTDGTAAQYWRARLPVLPGPPALPTDGQPQGRPRFVRRSARLSRTEWAGLRDLAAEHRVTPTAVLLTVYADALTRWSGSAGFSLTLTLFDRPPIHPHVNRVVGDFTSLVLHEVPAAPAAGFAERVAATQARLFEELDHRGFSALDVLAEQGARTGEVRSVPVVFTSALGMDGLLEEPGALEWAGEQVYALSQTPQTWLDHQVLEHDGELRLQWDALEGVLPADELETAIADHVAQVRELATDPRAWTGEHVQPAVQDVLLPLRTDPAPAARPTLFLAHPSGGDVLCYVELSKLIDPRVDVVAVADPELSGDGSAGPETISAIAGRYVQAIRTTGRGPWLLGGWSMGGSVAQEMARQLHQDGEQVSLLVMLDSNDPALIRAVPGRHADEVELAVALRHVHALEAFLGIDLDAGDALAALPRDQRLAAIEDRLRAHRLLGRGEGLRARLRVFARHLRALAAHTPAQGTDPAMRTLLVRADKPSPRNSGIGMGVDDTPPGQADLGWGRYLAGPVQVVGVGAHHYSLLHPPVLQQIAQLINNELDRVLP